MRLTRWEIVCRLNLCIRLALCGAKVFLALPLPIPEQEDGKQRLTELGRVQADITGQRLAAMAEGIDEKFGPCKIKVLRVSGLTRAKETAEIIAKHLPGVPLAEPDPLLNEGM